LWVHNKSDLFADAPASHGAHTEDRDGTVHVSARTGAGLDALHARLRALSLGDTGDAGDAGEGAFTARARHVEALRHASAALADAEAELARESLELAAEALRIAHDNLGEITGRMAPDDLLGHIFSSFCIGK
jgi:tRNA modification GTPase